MEFKFRAKVRVKSSVSKIIRPDGVASQAAFFAGSEGTIIRHDPQKGGYLIVLNCPEVAAAMGETITAYFNENELEAIEALSDGFGHLIPEDCIARPAIPTPYQMARAKNNRAKRIESND